MAPGVAGYTSQVYYTADHPKVTTHDAAPQRPDLRGNWENPHTTGTSKRMKTGLGNARRQTRETMTIARANRL